MSKLMSMMLAIGDGTADNTFGWVDTLVTVAKNVLIPILTLVAIAGVIYAIVVGVKFVRAEDKTQRDEAKQKLITVIVGIVVTAVLIVLFLWLANGLSKGGWLYRMITRNT